MERTIHKRVAFQGRLLTLEVLDVELENGGESVREIIRHPGAVVVFARRADGKFILVRQYRKAVDRVLVEAVAGTLETGESPEACAARELKEETGYTARDLRKLGTFFSAPGYTDEVLHAFCCTVEEKDEATPEYDEHVEVVVLSEDELLDMMEHDEIVDAKTLAVWHLYSQAEHHAHKGGH